MSETIESDRDQQKIVWLFEVLIPLRTSQHKIPIMYTHTTFHAYFIYIWWMLISQFKPFHSQKGWSIPELESRSSFEKETSVPPQKAKYSINVKSFSPSINFGTFNALQVAFLPFCNIKISLDLGEQRGAKFLCYLMALLCSRTTNQSKFL